MTQGGESEVFLGGGEDGDNLLLEPSHIQGLGSEQELQQDNQNFADEASSPRADESFDSPRNDGQSRKKRLRTFSISEMKEVDLSSAEKAEKEDSFLTWAMSLIRK